MDNDSKRGEGFAAISILCILIEFFQSFYRGEVYRYGASDNDIELKRLSELFYVDEAILKDHIQPFEYRTSSRLFTDFLRSHEPFKTQFKNRRLIDEFYKNVRCGLLHEAATKKNYKIRSEKSEDIGLLIERTTNGDDYVILYRTPFHNAIKQLIHDYKLQLVNGDTDLKQNFIRKMDDLCQIRRIWYFAYGSNLKEDQLRDRIDLIHHFFVGYVKNHALVFNKKKVLMVLQRQT